MVEIIHEHDTASGDGSNAFGMMAGLIFAVVVILFLFYYFGRGLLQGAQAPQVNIPDHVNVNVQQQKAPAAKPGY